MVDQFDRLTAALADRYRIERELGRGGMATVYLAEDLKHHRKVAVKVLRPELAAILGGERFLKEIEVTANLQHPNILPLFDSGEADTLLYYVTPFIAGESLRQRLDREKQLSVEEARRITKALARALDHAHRQGVIHRDIKPENILFQDHEPVLADFGIALAARSIGQTRLTETGLSLGTPHYMSPEQASGDREIGPASDVYALACVLYEMLVGQPPHSGPTAQAIVAAVLTEKPKSARALRDDVPASLAAAINRALAKVPSERFTGAVQFHDAVEHMKAPSRLRSWLTARSSRVGALVVLAVVTIVAARGFFTPRMSSETIERIAVMPLENQTGDADQEYFVVGMTEALITNLGQVGLSVLSRQSVARFAGSNLSLPEIARQLDLDAVLVGSVFRSAERMRVDVRFVAGKDERQIWGRSFDTTMTAETVFDVQAAIASSIAGALEMELSPRAMERLARRPTANASALTAVQRGIFQWLTAQSIEDYDVSMQYFTDAIALDSLYAEAWNMRGAVRALIVSVALTTNPALDLALAKQDVLRSLELDSLNHPPGSGSARSHLGFVRMYEWDFAEAEQEYQRAIREMGEQAAGPYPVFLSMTGQADRAMEFWNRFLPTDRTSFIRINIAMAHWWAGEYARGLGVVEQLPPGLREMMALPFQFRLGRIEEALPVLDALYDQPLFTTGLMRQSAATAVAMAIEGLTARNRPEDAGVHFARFQTLFAPEKQMPMAWAAAHLARGDDAAALAVLRRALARRDPTLAWVGQLPELDALRGHPGFHEIVAAVGVPNPRLSN